MTSNGSTMTDIKLEHVKSQPTVVVRFNYAEDTVGELMSAAIIAVQEYLKRAQMLPVGPPFTRYLVWTEDQKRAESGFPVEWAVEGGDLVESSELPAGRVARMVYTGPYTGLLEAKNKVFDAIRARGLTPDGGPIEVYVTDPNEVIDESDFQTEIIWPIE